MDLTQIVLEPITQQQFSYLEKHHGQGKTYSWIKADAWSSIVQSPNWRTYNELLIDLVYDPRLERISIRKSDMLLKFLPHLDASRSFVDLSVTDALNYSSTITHVLKQDPHKKHYLEARLTDGQMPAAAIFGFRENGNKISIHEMAMAYSQRHWVTMRADPERPYRYMKSLEP